MLNLAGSRKSTNQKNVKLLTKSLEKIKLFNGNFEDILKTFEQCFNNKLPISEIQNKDLSKYVRQFLSSLKFIYDKDNFQVSCVVFSQNNNELFSKGTNNENIQLMLNCLNILNEIVSDESIFPETLSLSGICIPFLLIIGVKYYFNDFHNANRASLVLFFKLFQWKDGKFDEDIFNQELKFILVQITNDKISNNISKKIENMVKIIVERPETKFRNVVLWNGLLNCYPMLDILFECSCFTFYSIFPSITKLCNSRLSNEFYVYRLMNQYLKIFYDYSQILIKNRGQKNYDDKLMAIFQQTMPIIDSNWESCINGVNNLMKQNYQYLIKLMKLSIFNFKLMIIDQLESSIHLPFTCKAKYRKLAIIIDILSDRIQADSENADLQNIFELPFNVDPDFAIQTVKHLSINTLSNCIAEFYKTSLNSIVFSSFDEKECTQKWSNLWLKSITFVFKSDLIQSSVVQANISSQILPCTVKLIPESFNILFYQLSDCLLGQACLVRIFLEKFSRNNPITDILPEPKWILKILIDYDDMTRAEGLALLLQEKFIVKNRALICKILLKFLRNNLNIDNPVFRQRILSLLERFYFKIVVSLCDKFDSVTRFNQLNEMDQFYVQFLNKTFNLLAISLFPGSCYQRKYTALNLLGSIFTLIKSDNKKATLKNLLSQTDEKIFERLQLLILFGMIDKDDKIRRLSCKVLVLYYKLSMINKEESYLELINSLSLFYVQSFRHQECHIGGLLFEYFLKIDFKFSLIELLISKAQQKFYSEDFRQNLLKSSHTDPLHGWILSLNHCLNFDSFYQFILKNNSENFSSDLVINKNIRREIYMPIIKLAIDCLDYFLEILIPNFKIQKLNTSEYQEFYDNEEDFEDYQSYSPSFLEICESIKQIVHIDSDLLEDFSSTNQFQLILSMCWLNIKESCFLLTNITRLFSDLLGFIVENGSSLNNVELLILPEEICMIGNKIVNLLQRCRHKGVIEAAGVSLTQFTQSFLRIQYYLIEIAPEFISQSYQLALKQFTNEILSVISMENQQKTSVTRRSAGLALIVQSVLIGESESIHLYRIKQLNNNGTLYERFVSLLIKISQIPITEDLLDLNDLCQANALHILRSIIGTSSLSHLTYKTAEDLFQICITGFTHHKHWQIRNASLQLFGVCVTRMLGQKKRTLTNSDSFESDESTITIIEFESRYPNLMQLISMHLETLSLFTFEHKPELVPVLAVLASFSPINDNKSKLKTEQKIKESLIKCLSNKSWKIRMLAAKSLSNILSISEFESFITDSILSKEKNPNLLHGLICCINNLIKHTSKLSIDIEEYRQKLYKNLEHLIENVPILKTTIQSIFMNDVHLEENLEVNNDKKSIKKESITSDEVDLSLIKSNISFKMPDNIRLESIKHMTSLIENSTEEFLAKNLFSIADILIILFEDEDRQVRFYAQNLAAKLIVNNNSTQIYSQNVAFDCILRWILSYSNGHQILLELICTHLVKIEEYLNGQDQIYILFEKEEKNVFSEPYITNIRLINFLIDNLKDKSVDFDYNLMKFQNILQQLNNKFQQIFILNKSIINKIEELMRLSIWKMPKIFCLIVTLYMSVKLNIALTGDFKFQDALDNIELHFPFIQLLCTNYRSIGIDLISFEL